LTTPASLVAGPAGYAVKFNQNLALQNGSNNSGNNSNGSNNGNNNQPPPTPTPPVLIGEVRIFRGHGRHKKLVGFELLFSGALNADTAQSVGDYQVTQLGGHGFRALPVLSAGYNSSNNSVLITVGGFK
jgi:hypothetical protein